MERISRQRLHQPNSQFRHSFQACSQTLGILSAPEGVPAGYKRSAGSARALDLRGFTRDLMRQVELDLATRLDWIAVDNHNTGHPRTHIIVRGVLDDGRILNIAGDYIAHGIRHRATELVTRELGHPGR